MTASTDRTRRQGTEGLAMLLVLGYLAILMIGSTAFFTLLNTTLSQTHAKEESRRCLNLAEAGLDKALAELRHDASGYHGEQETVLGDGRFTVKVAPMEHPSAAPGAKAPRTAFYRVTSTGLLPKSGALRKPARIIADVSVDTEGRVDILRWSEGRS